MKININCEEYKIVPNKKSKDKEAFFNGKCSCKFKNRNFQREMKLYSLWVKQEARELAEGRLRAKANYSTKGKGTALKPILEGLKSCGN